MSYVKKLTGFACLAVLFTLSYAAEPVLEPDTEAEVQTQVIAFNRAYELNDLDSYFSYYCENATMWVNTDFLQIADYREDWYGMIGNGGGVLKNTVSDIRVQASSDGDAAVASYRLDIETRQPTGLVTRDQAQETDAWFRSDGKWCVAHLHYSFQTLD